MQVSSRPCRADGAARQRSVSSSIFEACRRITEAVSGSYRLGDYKERAWTIAWFRRTMTCARDTQFRRTGTVARVRSIITGHTLRHISLATDYFNVQSRNLSHPIIIGRVLY